LEKFTRDGGKTPREGRKRVLDAAALATVLRRDRCSKTSVLKHLSQERKINRGKKKGKRLPINKKESKKIPSEERSLRDAKSLGAEIH